MTRVRRFSLLLLAALAASLALWRLMPTAREPLTATAVPALVLPGATDERPAPLEAAPETTGTNPETEAEAIPTPDSQPPRRTPLDTLLDRATLLAERTESLPEARVRRQRVWETDGTWPFVRTEEIITQDDRGHESVRSRVAMVADHVLVQLGTIDPVTIERLSRTGLDVHERMTESGLYRARLTDFGDPSTMSRILEEIPLSIPAVQFAEPDFLVFASVTRPDDALLSEQWALADSDAGIDAFSAWDTGTDAGAVIVAVVDSGLRLTHEDLRDNLWSNPGETPGNGLDDDSNGIVDDDHGFNAITSDGDPNDDYGHGTHVAGIVGAQGDNRVGISGIAWNVRLMALKFMGPDGSGTTSDAVRCIDYAARHGAAIVNASWGGEGRSLALEQAITRLGQAGGILVAAAGNESRDISTSPSYPASFKRNNVLAVAASDWYGGLAGISNFGNTTVALAAPGIDIYSAWHTDDSAYIRLSGTSMAAPMVSGALALLKARRPTDDAEALMANLVENSLADPRLLEETIGGRRLYLGPEFGRSPGPPLNDAIAGAIAGTDRGFYWEGPTRGATLNPGEPAAPSPSFSRSIWFALSSEAGGSYEITAGAPADRTALSVFWGQPSASSRPTASAAGALIGQSVTTTVRMEPGSTVSIAVYGTGDGSRASTLRIAAAPENDDFAKATVLTGSSFNRVILATLATRETGEPVHGTRGTGRTVWWTWTAPRSGLFDLSTAQSRPDTILAVYRGNSMSHLELVGSNDDAWPGVTFSQVAFVADEGTTYRIALDVVGDPNLEIRMTGEFGRPPVFSFTSEDVRVPIGETVDLQCEVEGTHPIRYQWYRDGTALRNATDPHLTLLNPALEDAGSYWLVAENAAGENESRRISVNIGVWLPFIVSQPVNRHVRTGGAVVLSINFRGTPPLRFQWAKDGTDIEGANQATLKIESAGPADAGDYVLRISNDRGEVTSNSVRLEVFDTVAPVWRMTYPGTQMIDFERFKDVGEEVWALGDGRFQVWTVDDIWETRDTGIDSTLVDGAAGSGRYVLTNFNGQILESADAYSWTSTQPSGIGRSWIAYGNGTFLVADIGGSLHRSTASGVWQKTDSPIPGNTIPVLTFFENLFYAAYSASSSNHVIKTSADGVEWESASIAPGISGTVGRFLHGADGKLYLFGLGSMVWRKEVDGEWTAISPPLDQHIGMISEDGSYAVRSNRLYRSGDLHTWDWIENGDLPLRDLHFRDGRFFFNIGPTVYATTSLDAAFWDSVPWTSERDLLSNDILISTEGELYSGAMASGDGTVWNLGTSELRHDEWTFGNGFFLNASNQERGRHPGATEPFPEFAEPIDLENFSGFRSAFGLGTHVFLERSAVHLTTDGSGWSTVILPGSATWTAFEFLDGRFIGLSDDGRVLVGTDLSNWAIVDSGRTGPLTDVAYGLNRYVITTATDALLISTDARTWQSVQIPDGSPPQAIASGGGRFVAISDGRALESTDLVSWRRNDPDMPRVELRAIEYLNGTFVALTRSHELLQLGEPVHLAPRIEIVEPAAFMRVNPLDALDVQARVSDPGNLRVTTRLAANGEAQLTTDASSIRHTEIVTDAVSQAIVLNAENEAGLRTSRAISYRANPYRTESIFPSLPEILALTKFQGALYRGGVDGVFQRSLDGRNWADLPSPRNGADIRDLIAGEDELYVIVDNHLLSSPNGINWRFETYADDYGPLETVTPLGDMIFSSHPYPQVRTADGVWRQTQQNFGIPVVLNGRFYGGNAGALPSVSMDGLDWSPIINLSNPGTRGPILFDGQVVYHDVYPLTFHTSRNGIDWITFPGPPASTPSDPESGLGDPVVVGRGILVSNLQKAFITYDLESWTELPSSGFSAGGQFGNTDLLLFTDGLFAMEPGKAPRLIRSIRPDEIPLSNWAFFATKDRAFFSTLWSGSRMDIIETDGSTASMIRHDSLALPALDFATTDTMAAIMGLGWNSFTRRVKIGGGPWQLASTPTEEAFSGLAGSSTKLVAVGYSHKFSHSTDGVNWTFGYMVDYDPNGPEADKYRYGPDWVTYHEPIDRFIAGGSTGIWLSQGGATWINHPEAKDIPKAYSNGSILLGMHRGLLWTSSDGIAWTQLPDGSGGFQLGGRLGLIGPGLFGNSGSNFSQIRTTVDGLNWTTALHPDSGEPFSGTMVESDDVPRIIADGYTWVSNDLGVSWVKERPTALRPYSHADFISLRGELYDLHNHSREPALVDLSVAIPSNSPLWIRPGQTTKVPLRIQNNSPFTPFTGRIDTQLIASPRPFWLRTPLAPPVTVSLSLAALAPGSFVDVEVDYLVPTTVGGGQHHLAAWIDSGDTIFELNERNNYGASDEPILKVRSWLLSVNADAGGSVAITPAGPHYSDRTVVTLTPVPNPGYGFVGWDDTPAKAINTLSLTMDRDRTLRARFEPRYRLDLRTTGRGLVTVEPELPDYPPGTNVTLTATAEQDWLFEKWSTGMTGFEPITVITMDRDRTATARFGQPFTVFQNDHFPSEDLLDPAVSGPEADADFDGWSNLFEYLLGGDPRAAQSTPLILLQSDTNRLKLVFTRRSVVSGYEVEARASTDLVTWSRESVTETILQELGDTEIIEASVATTTSGPIHLRLFATETPIAE